MGKFISGRDILKQLRADLIGKDSHRGVTLTYAWLANQFGHFALGFIPTFILYICFSKLYSEETVALRSAIFISVLWLAFETYNFLGPLLGKKNSKSKIVFIPGERHMFSPAWRNIAFDTATDLLFFWLGAFTASLICAYTSAALVVLLFIIASIIYPASYWYLTKMYLQLPQYPIQFRLSQWEHPIGEKEIEQVKAFLKMETRGSHLLIFGSRGSGKTSLGVAMATELSITHQPCTYTSAMKLYCLFFEPDAGPSPTALWSWRNASILVIDDLNPGEPIKEDIVNPKVFLKFLDADATPNDLNRKALKNKNVIWILGNEHSDKETAGTWANMLESIGVEAEKIFSINLLHNTKV